jgi:hypothetical protein
MFHRDYDLELRSNGKGDTLYTISSQWWNYAAFLSPYVINFMKEYIEIFIHKEIYLGSYILTEYAK